MNNENAPSRSPLAWVPSLYFAEGLPLWIVLILTTYLYKGMHVGNDQITRWTGIITFAWAFKPLWSPLLQIAPSKKRMVVLFQALGGIALILLAFSLHLESYFYISIFLFGMVALISATHDIVADGLYIASLSGKLQTIYAGWQGGFYNTAKFVAVGPLVILAGMMIDSYGLSVQMAWSAIFISLGVILLFLALYHSRTLPDPRDKELKHNTLSDTMGAFWEVSIDFFRKKGVWVSILFILLFRAGEAQVTAVAQLFLLDSRAAGGLGLTTAETGALYGIAGTLAFIGGSIIGGYFAAWLGLRRAMLFLVLGMNLPNVAFFFLSTAMPENYAVIAGAIFVENFGFGFGFVGLVLYMMQVVSVGNYRTAHYAIATGFMALGLTLFRGISGDIQVALGYQHFFIWVLVSAIPVLLMSFWIVPKNLVIQSEDSAEQADSSQSSATA